jgi:hypothetical protein
MENYYKDRCSKSNFKLYIYAIYITYLEESYNMHYAVLEIFRMASILNIRNCIHFPTLLER